MSERESCPMRHENGNCLPAGGFCTAVNDPICDALHNAYENGRCSVETGKNVGDKWVSAEEPPKENDEYIVRIKGAKKATVLYYRVQENIWFDDAINLYKVTHWQPMPEIPKGVQ